jgi:hypothetical protein
MPLLKGQTKLQPIKRQPGQKPTAADGNDDISFSYRLAGHCLAELVSGQSQQLTDIVEFVHECALSVHMPASSSMLTKGQPVANTGLVLSPKVSSFHHSCEPNAWYSLNDRGEVEVRSLCLIRKGQPITVSFIPDLMLPTAYRKSHHLYANRGPLSCMCRR